MTRFWLTLEQGVQYVLGSIDEMEGGEVFVPKIPSMRIMDLAQATAPECEVRCIGIRPGEKLHEVLLSEDEARHSIELETGFVIMPMHPWWKGYAQPTGKTLPEGFRYASDTNTEWLTVEQIRALSTDAAGVPSPRPETTESEQPDLTART
jgi:UDP-N-acetylglucosamine 4,6-dehydratase